MSFPFCWHYKQLIFTPFLAGTSPTRPTKIMDSKMLRFWDGALASTVRTLHPWLPTYRLICVNHFSLQDISRRWICSRKQILFPKLVLWWVVYMLFFLVDKSILMQYLCDLLWCYGPIWASIVFSRSLYIYIYLSKKIIRSIPKSQGSKSLFRLGSRRIGRDVGSNTDSSGLLSTAPR